MAETTTDGTTVIDEGATSPAEPAPIALSQEERDNQTIDRLLGRTPEPKPETPAAPPADAEEKTDEEEPEETADADDGEGADDEPEITDEDLETIIDALDERLLAHPRIAKILEERAKTDADRRFEEQRRTTTAAQESERLIAVGRKAVDSLYGLFGKSGEQLAKAAKGEEFEQVIVDPDEFKTHMRDYGAAVTLVTRKEFDDAFTTGFTEASAIGGALTTEEAEKVKELVQTARRIEQDPKQGTQAAKNHLFTEGMKFLAERAKAAGKAETESAIQRRRTAISKVVGDNSITAATAKLAKTRKGLPPKPTQGEPEGARVANMETYRKLKAEGKHDEAQAVADQMAAARAAGR